jgi:hypothetical protein
MIIVMNGGDLSPEAWDRTRDRANTPSHGFGMTNRDGFKWMFANQIFIERDKAKTLREQDDKIRQLGGLVEKLAEDNRKLQALAQSLSDKMDTLENKRRPPSK